MAIVKGNLVLQHVRGSLGDQVTIYERGGQIIIAQKRGRSWRKPTEAQLAARQKMRDAASRATMMLARPGLKEYYSSLAGPGQNAYNLALRDAYHDLEIQDVRLVEEEVVVATKHESSLTEVQVEIKDAEGITTESGKAVLGRNKVGWRYKAAALPAGGKVIVTAIGFLRQKIVKELLLVRKEVFSLADELVVTST